jgi:integrase
LPTTGRGLRTREFYKQLAETAGVDGSAKVIRHTVRTYLAEQGVPDSEADQFMGHREEGSPTGRRYKHRRPEFLRSVVEAIEELYAEINELMKRPFKDGRKRISRCRIQTSACTCVPSACQMKNPTSVSL